MQYIILYIVFTFDFLFSFPLRTAFYLLSGLLFHCFLLKSGAPVTPAAHPPLLFCTSDNRHKVRCVGQCWRKRNSQGFTTFLYL